jgi:hypothetical protein
MTSVKVAVRVRPFNKREKEREAVSIIKMNPGNQTVIKNPVRIYYSFPNKLELFIHQIANSS